MIGITINHSSRIIHSSEYSRIIELMGDMESCGYLNPSLIIENLGDGTIWCSTSNSKEAQRYPVVSFTAQDDNLWETLNKEFQEMNK